jgi:dTDP-4-amino-4,6-dideoxygalactose transaminase
MSRVSLSSPHLGTTERGLLLDAFDSNWVAPLGPHVDAFEREFAELVKMPHAAALSSGTAALHLALKGVGVGPGDEVLVSSLTFAASANPVVYCGARPVFVDSELTSWNMDPALLATELAERARRGNLPKAVVVVDLYGQCADWGPISEQCRTHGVPLIEDAAEALGATYRGKPAGSFGDVSIFSFNGNKIITTGGGGMLVATSPEIVVRTRHLATQARDSAPHYEHSSIGFNYRLSNLLAAVGRGQLKVLPERIAARRANNAAYKAAFAHLPGVSFMPIASWGEWNGWLTVITVDPARAGVDRETIRTALEADQIESRPVWKPMHLQPVFRECRSVGGAVSERIFEQGLCLPSGSNLEASDRARVIEHVRRLVKD